MPLVTFFSSLERLEKNRKGGRTLLFEKKDCLNFYFVCSFVHWGVGVFVCLFVCVC